MKVLFVTTESHGLQLDRKIICDRLLAQAHLQQFELEIQTITIPAAIQPQHISLQNSGLQIHPDQDAIFFLERVYSFDCPFEKAKRILIPNVEYVNPQTTALLASIHICWHKTRFSHAQFMTRLPLARHDFMGFTSEDPNTLVTHYDGFAHFRGKALGRHSEEVINVWKRNPDLPQLKYHFYQDPIGGFVFDEWLICRNIAIQAGKMEPEKYNAELASAGFHVCTSGAEGFGHYINEARAMAAVPVVLNAPPMNELVDEDCGVLVEPVQSIERNFSRHFFTSEEQIEKAVRRALQLSDAERRAKGQRARARFLSERDEFHRNLEILFDSLRQEA
jgi:hypothetical protein